jgi:tRNA/rRNA methyltransferase
MLTNCRVVLVRPEVAGNIGATARVMRNFGFTELVLVEPVGDPNSHDAKQRATHGEDVLNSARIVPTLGDALADCRIVVGTTARTSGLVRQDMAAAPGAVVERVARHLRNGPVALVFGSEPVGLTNDEIGMCTHLLSIPAADDFPALNLSHAVAICLYELRNAWSAGESNDHPRVPATHDEREQMFGHLREALEEIHFLYNEKSDLLMHAIRQLINRAEPDELEVRLLHGIAKQMQWVARKAKRPE